MKSDFVTRTSKHCVSVYANIWNTPSTFHTSTTHARVRVHTAVLERRRRRRGKRIRAPQHTATVVENQLEQKRAESRPPELARRKRRYREKRQAGSKKAHPVAPLHRTNRFHGAGERKQTNE